MPRKSSAALAIATPISVQRRLQAPAGLTDFQRTVWVATVNARPASWFGDEHLPILLEYVRHVQAAHDMADMLEAYDAIRLENPDHFSRYERLIRLRAAESNMIQRLASAMRMTQNTVHQVHKRIPEQETAADDRKAWRKQA